MLRTADLDARFEPREKLHATVAFLGNVVPERYGEVVGAFGSAGALCRPFTIAFDRVGAFPNERRPRVVWLGSSSSAPAFDTCAERVRTAFQRLGWTFEHDASAHVTLCRLKRTPPALPPVRLERATLLQVDALSLYESVPEGRTTRYRLREQVRLAPAPM